MASSEIEVVTSPESKPQTTAESAVVDVFSAAAYGDFEKLRRFVEEDGASVAKPDANGYHAIQWAALNNFPDIAQYIVEVFVFIFWFDCCRFLVEMLSYCEWKRYAIGCAYM